MACSLDSLLIEDGAGGHFLFILHFISYCPPIIQQGLSLTKPSERVLLV